MNFLYKKSVIDTSECNALTDVITHKTILRAENTYIYSTLDSFPNPNTQKQAYARRRTSESSVKSVNACKYEFNHIN